MELSHSDRAQVLVEALPYIQEYNKKTVVVKYGGNAMISDDLRKAVISDIILLKLVGINVVVVHGGGPEINEMLKKTGKESKFVNGLRYTDEETMDVVQMVLCGKVNKNLVSTLNRSGGSAIGLCGLDGRNALRIVRRDHANHLSPNCAWSEAAAAGALHIRLGGTHLYFGKPVEKPSIGDDGRAPEPADIRRVNRMMYAASLLMLLLVWGTYCLARGA